MSRRIVSFSSELALETLLKHEIDQAGMAWYIRGKLIEVYFIFSYFNLSPEVQRVPIGHGPNL